MKSSWGWEEKSVWTLRHTQTHVHTRKLNSWMRPRMYGASGLPLSCQRNHVLSHSANTTSAQRGRKQNSSCHLFASPPVQTSKPPQRLVIKSPGFAVLRSQIKHLSLFHACLYLDKQMTTCSEPVQRIASLLPASFLGQTHSDTHMHKMSPMHQHLQGCLSVLQALNPNLKITQHNAFLLQPYPTLT